MLYSDCLLLLVDLIPDKESTANLFTRQAVPALAGEPFGSVCLFQPIL